MSMPDEDLRDEVNNALNDEDLDDTGADNDQDDIAEDDSSEDDHIVEDDADIEDDEDDQSGKDKQTRSAPVDDEDLEDDEDDPALDYARPEFGDGSAPQVKEFDIRTLPKDPETGLIDPVEANRLINEHYASQGKASEEAQAKMESTKRLLTEQWVRVSKKYPAVYKKPQLRDIARTMHLNSIGTDNYLTPAQAAAKVDRMRRSLEKTGYKSAKTRRTVENMTRTERNSGKAGGGQESDYEKAKKLAMSRDPNKAKQGRMAVLKIRREARKRR